MAEMSKEIERLIFSVSYLGQYKFIRLYPKKQWHSENKTAKKWIVAWATVSIGTTSTCNLVCFVGMTFFHVIQRILYSLEAHTPI